MGDVSGLHAPYPSEHEAARQCAIDISEHLANAHRARGRSVLAICGGRSVGLVLPHLRPVHPVTVIATDERWLPPDSPDRNDRALIEHFGDASVLRMPYTGILDSDAKTWAMHLWQLGTPDVALLSMADDGHVASLFPRHRTLDAHAPIVVERESPKPPPARLSLSVARIRCIPNRLVIAIGSDKSPMIDQIRQGSDTPATRIKPTRWYLDSAASSTNGGGR